MTNQCLYWSSKPQLHALSDTPTHPEGALVDNYLWNPKVTLHKKYLHSLSSPLQTCDMTGTTIFLNSEKIKNAAKFVRRRQKSCVASALELHFALFPRGTVFSPTTGSEPFFTFAVVNSFVWHKNTWHYLEKKTPLKTDVLLKGYDRSRTLTQIPKMWLRNRVQWFFFI